MKEILLIGLFLFVVYSGICVSSYEIVSDSYSVETYSIGIVGEETNSSNMDSRHVLATESGGFFESDSFFGEVKKFPDKVSLEDRKDSSSGGTGSGGGGGGGGSSISSAGGGGGGGEVSKLECVSNEDCKKGISCVQNKCVKVYDLSIIDFESPAKLGENFDFIYSIERKKKDTVGLNTLAWIEDERGNVLSYNHGELQVAPFEKITDSQEILLPEKVKEGVYVFYLRIDDENATLIDLRDIEINVRGNYAYLKKVKNFTTLIIIMLSLAILGIIAWINKKKTILFWNILVSQLKDKLRRKSNEK